MNAVIITKAIRAMCTEVQKMDRGAQNWHLCTEEELLYEVAICTFGSQMLFELAVGTANRLKEKGYLQPQEPYFDKEKYTSEVVAVLSELIVISNENGIERFVRPRFKNRLASLLATSLTEIYSNGYSIKQILLAADSPKQAREILIKYVSGFGPKQSSLFLRRIGYCTDLAVLDIHVMDYLSLVRGSSIKSNKLGHLSYYEKIETDFREIADDFGHSMGCVDLATWLTMRVAKKERQLWVS